MKFFVAGEPRPQGSKTPVRMGNRIRLIESSGSSTKKHADWRKTLKETAIGVWKKPPIDGPCSIKLEFYLPRPKARTKERYSSVKPDIDKLCRSVLDGLSDADVLRNDSRVSQLNATKYYANDPSEIGVWIEIEEKEQC